MNVARAARGAVAVLLAAMLISVRAQDVSRQAPSMTEAVLAVQVNLESKGDYLVLIAQDGDILVREQDFAALGLTGLPRQATRIDGVAYIPLRSVPNTTFNLDMQRLVLAVRVDPRQLSQHHIVDLAPQRDPAVLRPVPAGAFLNYNFTQNWDGNRSGLDTAGEVGVRFGEYLFSSDAYASEDLATGARRGVRLSTSLVRDRRDTLQRLTYGDFLTVQPGPLGSSLRLGGISFSRRYSIDPYYVRFPGQVVSGTAALPSEVFVYSNGILIRRERIGPGGFELQNLVNLPGLQNTEVVVRDVLGNEQRIVDPFYYSESLLRPGLDEYSFDAGFERRQFGVVSNDYGRPGFAAFYRRGLTSGLTLGAHAEALNQRYNFGPTASFSLGLAGVTTLDFAYGGTEHGSGAAVSALHSFHSLRWTVSAAARFEGREFARAASDSLANRRYDTSLAVSHALTADSSVSFGLTATAPWDGTVSRSRAVEYRMRASRDVYLSAALRHASGDVHSNELLFTLSWYFDAAAQRHLASFQARHDGDTSAGLVQLSGGNPDAEGLVYRVSADSGRDPMGSYRTFNPAAQWNGRYALLRAETFSDSRSDTERSQFSVQGGVAAVGGEWAMTRPVSDSFAIVKVGEVPGVRVYANNQVVATTNDAGTAFVPRLASYFENPVSIEDKDLPINYLVPKAKMIVSPALRSGVLLDFQAREVSAIAGRLVVHADGAVRPFADGQGELMVGGQSMEIQTSRDGSFYVEQVPPGRYNGEAQRRDGTCRFTIEVKRNHEVVADLGEVICAN